MRKWSIALFVVTGLTGRATADFTASYVDALSFGVQGDPQNTVLTYMYSGADFAAGQVTISGTITDLVGLSTPNWLSDAVVGVTAPDGSFVEARTSRTNSGGGATETYGPEITLGLGGTSAIGMWTFEFYELGALDDAPGAADNRHDLIDITISPEIPQTTLDTLSLGVLTQGSTVTGDTSGSTDDMNGSAGIGSDGTTNWWGGDDVYTLEWSGGDLVIDLLFENAVGDLDMLLWSENTANIELDRAFSIDDNEQITQPNLAAGTYYIHVDGWQGAENQYTLAVTPEPGALALWIASAGFFITGRRR